MDQSIHEATDNDLQTLDQLIGQLPKAIETKLKIADVFSSIHQKMNNGIPYEIILESVFSSLDSVIPFDRISIALLEDDETLAIKWVKSKLPINEINKGYKATLKQSSLNEVIKSRNPRILSNLKEYLKLHPGSVTTRLILQDGIMSSLTCPLVINDRGIGCIFFSSGRANTYKQLHTEIFSEIAQSLALIIEQSLLKDAIAENLNREKLFRNTIHDLNNPLAVIKGTLDILEKKGWFNELNDNFKKSFLTLKRNSEAMISMVNDLVQMNEINSSTKVIHLIPCLLEDFLEEVFNDSLKMAKNKQIQIHLEKGENLPEYANFDPEYLKRAIENLISNAIKYSEGNTEIIIKVTAVANRLHFIFVDQGQGIPANEHNKLFKEFGKTSVRPTSGELSSGLGLANVKRIIEAHGGEVSVQSKVNVGSIFSFWIPIQNLH